MVADMKKNMNGLGLLPEFELFEYSEKNSKIAICIPLLNENGKIQKQLDAMAEIVKAFDIIICDGGSTDGSTEDNLMRNLGVNTKIIKISSGKLSDQLMLGYAFAVCRGYEGVITMDGNGKDGVEGVWLFKKALESGYDLIQGSRFMKGGVHENTPLSRVLAIKLIHAPIIRVLSGFKYTDTTNGFRAHNIRIFTDKRIAPFRYGTFETYSLIHYLTVIVPRLGYKVVEVPVLRKYPASGPIPTKISPIKGNLNLIKILLKLAFKMYNPKENNV